MFSSANTWCLCVTNSRISSCSRCILHIHRDGENVERAIGMDAPDNIINEQGSRADIKINGRGERGNSTCHTQRPRARRVYSNEPCRYLSSERDLSRYLVRSCCSIFLPRCPLIFFAVLHSSFLSPLGC